MYFTDLGIYSHLNKIKNIHKMIGIKKRLGAFKLFVLKGLRNNDNLNKVHSCDDLFNLLNETNIEYDKDLLFQIIQIKEKESPITIIHFLSETEPPNITHYDFEIPEKL